MIHCWLAHSIVHVHVHVDISHIHVHVHVHLDEYTTNVGLLGVCGHNLLFDRIQCLALHFLNTEETIWRER